MRLTLLYLLISGLALYAWRDWYKALCGLIILMAVMEHPDMPKTMFGIQGLNPWNFLLVNVMMSWSISRRREGLIWDMPRKINFLLLIYLLIIIVGFFRLLYDPSGIIDFTRITGREAPTTKSFWSEYLINTFKWVIPGMLLFDGCRNRSRFILALYSIAGIYFLLSLQVIKWMPLSYVLSGGSIAERSHSIMRNEIGYHRTDLSLILAGGCWAILSLKELARNKKSHVWLTIGLALIVFFGMVLTAGRGGYVAWAVTGLVLSIIRWRKYILLAPLAVVIIAIFIPGFGERISHGFTVESRDTRVPIHESTYSSNIMGDFYMITAGRSFAWPFVIEKIGEAPLLGYGREAILRTGTSVFLLREFNESFPHPHNAYLQWLLDNGWIGFLPVLLFYFLIMKYSISLFLDSRNLVFVIVGGFAISLVFTLIVGSLSGQTFYPQEGTVGMWCAIGILIRVFVERSRIHAEPKDPLINTIDDGILWKQTT